MHAKASTERIPQTYEFIKAHRKRFDVRTMCRVLEVAPSGSRLSNPAQRRIQAPRADSKHSSAQVRRRQSQQGLGNGYYVHSHMGRMALPRRGHGFVLQKDRRVVDATDDSPRARTRRSVDGRTPSSTPQNCHSFRSRLAVWQRRLAEVLQDQSS